MARPQWLIQLKIPEKCIDSRTSARENKRTFVIHRQKNEIVLRVKGDGCWWDSIRYRKVDYLFWCDNHKKCLVLVELKGRNFGTALKQIEDTLKRLYKLQPELRRFARQGGVCIRDFEQGAGGEPKIKRDSSLKKISSCYCAI